MQQLNRIDPAGPPAAYKTYQIVSPQDHSIIAACAQVGCQAWKNGWDSIIDETTNLGLAQAHYIRTESRRTFRELPMGNGQVCFRFSAGQRCFAEHRTRPETYKSVAGDWRAYGDAIRLFDRPADWVDDFATHQDQLADRLARG